MYSLTVPHFPSGPPGAPIGALRVALDATIAGSATITPHATVAGTFGPATVTLTDAAPQAVFHFTPDPGTAGTVTITTTNDAGLTDPAGVDITVGWFDVPGRAILEANARGYPGASGLGPYYFWNLFGPDSPNFMGDAGPDADAHYDPLWDFAQAKRYCLRKAAGGMAGFGTFSATNHDLGLGAAKYQQGPRYVLFNGGGIPAHHVHNRGFYQDWIETADPLARLCGLEVAYHAFNVDPYFAASLLSYKNWRENAYGLLAKLDAERFGMSHDPYTDTLYDNIVGSTGHFTQLTVSHAALILDPADNNEYFQPFMVGLACRSAIAYWEYFRPADGGAFLAKLKTVLDFVWDNAWVDDGLAVVGTQDNAFAQVNKFATQEGTGGRYRGASSLNLLMAPAYFWYYLRSGDVLYRQRGDRAYGGDLASIAYPIDTTNMKHWNQPMLWGLQGLDWRDQADQAAGHLAAYGGQTWPTATAYTFTGPSSGKARQGRGPFVVRFAHGLLAPGGIVTITPSDGSSGGAFYPAAVTLSADRPEGTFCYLPAAGATGTITLSVASGGALTDPASLSYTITGVAPLATGLLLTGPVSPSPIGVLAGPFTVALVPAGAVTGEPFGTRGGLLDTNPVSSRDDPPDQVRPADFLEPSTGGGANGVGRLAFTHDYTSRTFTLIPQAADGATRYLGVFLEGSNDGTFVPVESSSNVVPYTPGTGSVTMSLRIRFQYPTGATLGYSIERLADGKLYDHGDGTFKTSPTTLIAALPEDTGSFAGRCKVTLTPTSSAQFSDGEYCVTVHDTAAGNLVVAELSVVMFNGDDAPAPPNAVALTDPDRVAIVAAMWARNIDGLTAAQVLGVIAAVAAGGLWKDTQGHYHFRAIDGSADRVIVSPLAATRGTTTIQPGS